MSGDNDSEATSTKPFRFKDEAERRGGSEDGSRSHKRKRRHRHRIHRSEEPLHKRSRRSRRESPPESRYMNPDDAFRESLFDAMGDDEGATFWEGVYGQPIHKYPNQYMDEETGELETMDDDEYATYVRRKMWERSREGIEAAREETRKERARRKVEEEAEEASRQRTRRKRPRRDDSSEPHNNFVFDFEIEVSLKRGQQRKDKRRWRDLWTEYLRKWDELQDFAKSRDPAGKEQNLFLRNKIAWLVESGQRKDVNPENIEHFMQNAAGSTTETENNATLAAALKVERVRWHPDKIQQRYGFMDIDETTMKGVTATFQVLDKMWNEVRGSKD